MTRLVIAYAGSMAGLINELQQLAARFHPDAPVSAVYDDDDWELTLSISRHPAGKRLGPIEGLHDSNADGMRDPVFLTCPFGACRAISALSGAPCSLSRGHLGEHVSRMLNGDLVTKWL